MQQDEQVFRQNGTLQIMPIEQAREWYSQFAEFTQSILKRDLDYGVIPGTPKPALLKAGAEKLRFAYALGVELDVVDKTVDLERPFIDYTYKCTIKSKQGQILSQCEGSCNSMEAKFGYTWLPVSELSQGTDISNLRQRTSGKKLQEFDFAISKGETGGQYGKPASYWNMWKEAIKNNSARKIVKTSKSGKEMDAWEINESVTHYRVLNPEVIGLKNTIMKMAQKRAFVGAVLIATGASEFFTQDIEDMVINGRIYSDETPAEAIVESEPVMKEPEVKIEPKIKAEPPVKAVPQTKAESPVKAVPEIKAESQTKTEPPVKAEPAMKVEPEVKIEKPAQVLQPSWQAELEKCTSKKELVALYNHHKDEVDGSPEFKQLFSNKRKEFVNEPAAEKTAV